MSDFSARYASGPICRSASFFDELLADVQRYAGKRGFVDNVCLVGAEVVRCGVGNAPQRRAGG